MDPRPKVFVSYAREDAVRARPIVAILRSVRAEVFFDVDSIPPGKDWQEALHAAIRQAETMFLFWSRHASASGPVKDEWSLAVETKVTLIPVLLDQTPLPPVLGRIQWIDAMDRPTAFESLPTRHGSQESVEVARPIGIFAPDEIAALMLERVGQG